MVGGTRPAGQQYRGAAGRRKGDGPHAVPAAASSCLATPSGRVLASAVSAISRMAGRDRRPSVLSGPTKTATGAAVRRLDPQRDLGRLQATVQRLDRLERPLDDRDRPGQRLQHLPDRLEHPVPGRHFLEQPVALDSAGGVARVERYEVDLVPVGAPRLRRNTVITPISPWAHHRHRPRAGHARRPGRERKRPTRAVLCIFSSMTGRSSAAARPIGPPARPERQPGPRVERPTGTRARRRSTGSCRREGGCRAGRYGWRQPRADMTSGRLELGRLRPVGRPGFAAG